MGTLRAILALGAIAVLASCELLINTNGLDDGGGPGDGGSQSDARPTDGPASDGTTRDGGAGDSSSDHKSGDATGDGPLGDGSCPGEAGPTMVRVGSYCIDGTEVTTGDYAAFVAADAGGSYQPPQCSWKKGNYANATYSTCDAGPTCPAGNVDWCDAYVYCKWAGKRLCGAIGSGSAPYEAFADAAVDEWYAACSGPLHHVYPYGNSFDGGLCNGNPAVVGDYAQLPVTGNPGCVGGYAGIYDMSGNAAEWEDSCDESGGGDAAADNCRYRGGSANSSVANLECATPYSFGAPQIRSFHTDDLGFRCCAH
jgi:formylglycine-generating enzyme